MIITRNLINKFINLSNITDIEIINALNSLGYEVEKYNKLSNLNKGVVLGKIIDYDKAPNTDFLNLTKIDIGKSKNLEIICGANNLYIDMYVLVALPGAQLGNGAQIKESKIKDYISQGMLCSATELGYKTKEFVHKNDGIVDVISKHATDNNLGSKDILIKLGYDDSIFEYDITANRSYGLSAYETIKELAIYFKKKIKNIELIEDFKNEKKLSIKTSNASMIKGLSSIRLNVKHNKSVSMPFLNLMKHLTIKKEDISGIAEYTTIEQGQPILLLDGSKIKSSLILTTDFEDKKNNIQKGDLVLVHENEYVSVIGIKTNQKYNATIGTKDAIAISIAIDSSFMRIQYKKYNINNSSIQRYMRFPVGVNLNKGLLRFVNILQKEGHLIEYFKINEHKKNNHKNKVLEFKNKDISRLIGKKISDDKIQSFLMSLDFSIKKNKEIFIVTIPQLKSHVVNLDDLIEEILRLYGYDNVESQSPIIKMSKKKNDFSKEIIEIIIGYLLSNGFFESKIYSLTNEKQNEEINFFGYKNPHKLIKPLSSEKEVMRFNLIEGLTEVIAYNSAHNFKKIKTFTIENVFFDNDKYNTHLSLVIKSEPYLHQISDTKISHSFFYVKGLLNSLLKKIGLDLKKIVYKENKHNYFNPYKSSKVYYSGKLIAIMGELHPLIMDKHNIKNNVYGLEMNLSEIFNLNKKSITYIESKEQNIISRDISIVIENEIFNNLKNDIVKNVKYVKNIEVKDYYVGENISKGKVSLTLSIIFNNDTQLTDIMVNEEYDKIVKNIKNLKLTIK